MGQNKKIIIRAQEYKGKTPTMDDLREMGEIEKKLKTISDKSSDYSPYISRVANDKYEVVRNMRARILKKVIRRSRLKNI